MIQLNLQSGVPIYEQLREQIARLTALGILHESDKLPSVRSMAKELSVNPNTIQRAYSQLETEGIIYTVSGKGSFIADTESAKKKMIRQAKKSLNNDIIKAKELSLPKKEIIEIVDNVYKEG